MRGRGVTGERVEPENVPWPLAEGLTRRRARWTAVALYMAVVVVVLVAVTVIATWAAEVIAGGAA